MGENGGLLTLDPEELVFRDVYLKQTYTQTLKITNNLRATVEATIQCGSNDRFEVIPSKIFLKSGHSCQVQVKLKVLKYVQKKRAAEQGQRDVFRIKATYFDQKFYATFFLAPDEAGVGPSTAPRALRDPTPAHAAPRGDPKPRANDSPHRSPHLSVWRRAEGSTEKASNNLQENADSVGLDRATAPEQHAASALTQEESMHQSASRMDAQPLSSPGAVRTHMQGRQHWQVHEEEELLDRELQDELLATVEEQEQALREKDEMLEYLQSRLKAAEMEAAQVGGLMSEQEAANEAEDQRCRELQAANAQLEGANAQLRGRVQELAGELQDASEELAALGGLREQLAAEVADDVDVDALVESALARERAAQDARNRKVLELLKSKDDVIGRFEVRFGEAQAEARQLAASLAEARRRAETAEARAAELLEQRAKARKAHERQLAEAASLQAALRADTAALKAELEIHKKGAARKSPEPRRRDGGTSASKAKGSSSAREAALEAELDVTAQSLTAAKQEAEALSTGLAKANGLIEELQGQLAAQQESVASKEQELFQLQEQVTELEAILTEPGKDPVLTPSSKLKDLEEKVAALEVKNAEMEKALAAAHAEQSEGSIRHHRLGHEEGRGGCQGLQLAQYDSSAAGAIAELRASNAEKSALLAAAEERLARLEALHSIAQETAMCAEAQLEEMRAALVGLGEAAQLGKADALNARALAARLSARVSELVLSEQCARAAAESAARRVTEVQEAHQTEVAALREVARAKEKAFRDALQLQSNVGASAATAKPSTSHASADLLDAHAQAAIAAVQPSELADAGCQLHTTSSGLAETSQPKKSSNAIDAAEKEEAGRAKQDAAAAKGEAERLKVELLAKDAELQSASAAAQQAVAEADSRAGIARKEAEKWAREAEDRRMQLSVLMETLETLQAGSMGEKEQRIVSLTARFAAARLKEATAVRRADDLTKEAASREEATAQLHARLEAAERQLAQQRADLDAADKHAAQLTAQLDTAVSDKAAAEKELAATQAKLLMQEEVARAAAAEAEQQALQAQQALSAAQAELLEVRDNADRALQLQREGMQAEADAKFALLAEELQAMRAACEEAAHKAQVELAACQQEAEKALASRPHPEDFQKVLEQAQEKDAHAQAAAAEATVQRQHAEKLAAELDVLRQEAAELKADVEKRGAAMEGLHAILGRIERATMQQADSDTQKRQARWSVDGTWESRALSEDRRATADDVSLASLSKQLVHAKMSEANMQRKLRVSARAEQMLRERLSQRDQRIAELKAAVADAEAEAADAKRSLLTAAPARSAHPQVATQPLADARITHGSSSSLRPRTGGPTRSATNPAAEPDAVAVSTSTAPGDLDALVKGQQPEQTALMQTTPPTENARVGDRVTASDCAALSQAEAAVLALPAPETSGGQAGDNASAQEPHSPDGKRDNGVSLALIESSSPGVAAAATQCAASPQREMSEALADARLELARRDAEIEHLQGTLTQLVAASHAQAVRPSSAASAYEQDIAELSRQLREMQRECAAATVAATSVLSAHGKHGEDADGDLSISQLVDELVALLKEKQAAVKRLEAAAKEAAEERAAAAAQPLECSQRAVVRDLSVKVTSLTKECAQLKSERDVALERLHALRASLGSSRPLHTSETGEALALPLMLPGPQCTTAGVAQYSPLPPPSQHVAATEAGSLGGLCMMLGHHLDVLEASQEPLKTALHSCRADEAASGADADAAWTQAVAAALEQAMNQVVLEAGAMRSTLHVMSAWIPLLQAKPVSTSTLAATSAKDGPAAPGPLDAAQDGVRSGPGKVGHENKEGMSGATAAASAAVVAELKAKAEKWKLRCQELKREMAVAAAASAAREAAAAERLAEAQAAALHQTTKQRGERPMEAGRSATVQLQEARAEARAATARAAEAEARLAAAQKQLHTVRGGASAAQTALQEEILSLKASLAQEKASRSRIVESLRGTIDGLRAAGDVEGRLKAELVAAHEQLASTQAALEAAEGRASDRHREARGLREKLERAQAELRQRGTDAELQEHDATLRLSDEQQRNAQLETKLSAAEGERAALERAVRAALDAIDGAQTSVCLVDSAHGLCKAVMDMREKCRLLERQVEASAASSMEDRGALRWEGLLRVRRFRDTVKQLRLDLQTAAAEREAAREEALKQCARAEALQAEVQAQGRRLEEALRSAEEERQRAVQQHRAALADMAARMEAERAALRQGTAAAAAAAEDRARAAATAHLQEAQARAAAAASVARAESAQAAHELESMRQQFRAYQAVKTGEVAGLEARLRVTLSQPAGLGQPWKAAAAAGPGRPTNTSSRQPQSSGRRQPAHDVRPSEGVAEACGAAAEVASAVQREAVAAAEREADLERLQRQAAEAAAAEARETAEKLREKLQAAQRELRSVQDRLVAATAERRQQPAADFLKLQGQLASAQEALKAARSESSRRLRELQALQAGGSVSQSSGGTGAANAAALAAETAAREAAEAKLREVKAAHTRKKQLVVDLRKRVDELSEQLVKAQAQQKAQNLQGIENKARSAHAACARKDEMLRELRDRMEQLMHGAAARAAEADVAEDGSTVVRLRAELERLRAELAKKDALLQQLQAAHAQAEQAQEQAVVGSKGPMVQHRDVQGLQEAAQRQAALSACGQELLRSLKRALDLALLCMKTMSDAAEDLSCATQNGGQGVHWQTASADHIASLVDLSASEVRELLGEESGSTAAELAEKVAAMVSCCEAMLTAGGEDVHGSQAQMGDRRKVGIEEGLCAVLDAAEAEIHRAGGMLEDAVRQQLETVSEQGTAASLAACKLQRPASQALEKLSESLLESSLQELDDQ
ncbi:g2028 [Coccomyxa elongata]